MIVKLKPAHTYALLIFILIITINPAVLKAGFRIIPSVNKTGVLRFTNGGLLLTKFEIILFFLFMTGISSFGFNEYRKKKILTQRLKTIAVDKEEERIYLEHLAKEKEWLVEELHHRVKNNLQIVVSLLDSQSSYLTNPEALQALKSSQHRIYAISLVHQKLYQTESLSVINMEAYINDLLQYLQDEYRCNQQISVILKTVPLYLNLTSAIPLGLILNEAVSNILQYAFPEKARGEIKITLARKDPDNYVLCIADNGIGLPTEFDVKTASSLGSILMFGLSQQIHANLKIENINGVVITLNFKHVNTQPYPLSA